MSHEARLARRLKSGGKPGSESLSLNLIGIPLMLCQRLAQKQALKRPPWMQLQLYPGLGWVNLIVKPPLSALFFIPNFKEIVSWKKHAIWKKGFHLTEIYPPSIGLQTVVSRRKLKSRNNSCLCLLVSDSSTAPSSLKCVNRAMRAGGSWTNTSPPLVRQKIHS